MGPMPAGAGGEDKKSRRGPATAIVALHPDTLCMVFSFLGFLDLARCSAVCKSWNEIIKRSQFLRSIYCNRQRQCTASSDSSMHFEKPLKIYLKEIAMECHKSSLQEGHVIIDQWRGHSVGVDQCRMKMGLVLTGVSDKVMRLWSLDGYKCVEEYLVPDTTHLVDFDFDENKVVGLVGTHLCIWRRNGKRNIFPPHEGTFSEGLCMSYIDPEAMVGCADGTVRVFDMYSRKCSRILRMNAGPITCLNLSEDQMLFTGLSSGKITVLDLSSDQQIATLRSSNPTGIRSMCFNPCSHLVFAGSTSGYTSCWDLRTMKTLWETRVSPNVIYSLRHLQNDSSTLVVGGIDGVLRILNQNTGNVLSQYIMGAEARKSSSTCESRYGRFERKSAKRLSEDTCIGSIPRSARPPITCLAVGWKKVITVHHSKFITLWKFNE